MTLTDDILKYGPITMLGYLTAEKLMDKSKQAATGGKRRKSKRSRKSKSKSKHQRKYKRRRSKHF